jgi:TM2 domain-containing membrane protein YozV
MANPKSPAKIPPPPPPDNAVLGALLSFLIPGLGQVLQGRIGKGLLFFVCVYSLFFYGMYLGSGSVTLHPSPERTEHYQVTGNVYLPDTADKNNPWGLPRPVANVYNRPQYLGQFWVGIVAWPAIYQYVFPGKPEKRDNDDEAPKGHTIATEVQNFEKTPTEAAINAVHTSGDKLLELGWVYTVIAGVLNIMVIYDAFAGPAFPDPKKKGA